jgi:hypothetical protein
LPPLAWRRSDSTFRNLNLLKITVARMAPSGLAFFGGNAT